MGELNWVPFALMTVVCWGLYGAFLSFGAKGFEDDRIKAFLFVGVAYFLVAVLVPLAIIAFNGSGFDFGKSPAGVKWSLVAGVLGALGALAVLFALNMNPLAHNPKTAALGAAQVMALVFAGAPIVAAIYGLYLRKPDAIVDSLMSMKWQFYVGLFMAAAGGAMVTLFK